MRVEEVSYCRRRAACDDENDRAVVAAGGDDGDGTPVGDVGSLSFGDAASLKDRNVAEVLERVSGGELIQTGLILTVKLQKSPYHYCCPWFGAGT